MTAEAAAPVPPDTAPPRPLRFPGAVVLALCGLVLAAAATTVVLHDPTEEPISGDQASFVLQALSLQGGNLSYDVNDQQSWLELGWEPQPRGLFVQHRGDGWAFAKPYGYSVLLAPAIELGGARGISAVGAALLLAYAWCWFAIGRSRWGPVGAAVVATSATVASNAWLMAFPAHADLFVAVLVGTAVLGSVRLLFGRPVTGAPTPTVPLSPTAALVWACVATGATAFLVTEKLPALVAVGPLLLLALWRTPVRTRLAAVGVGAALLVLTVLPYLYYSDGSSWNAYGGDRYYAPSVTPWSGGTDDDLVAWHTADSMSPGRVVDQIAAPVGRPRLGLSHLRRRPAHRCPHLPTGGRCVGSGQRWWPLSGTGAGGDRSPRGRVIGARTPTATCGPPCSWLRPAASSPTPGCT